MRKRNVAVIGDPVVRSAQARQVLASRVGGASIEQIASKYRVSRSTVMRRLAQAKAEGGIDDLRARLFETLVPLALGVLEQHLGKGSLEAARDILTGLGILRRYQPLADDLVEEHHEEQMTLDRWREERAARMAADQPPI